MGSSALAFMDIRIGSCHTLQLSFSLDSSMHGYV